METSEMHGLKSRMVRIPDGELPSGAAGVHVVEKRKSNHASSEHHEIESADA